MGVGGTAGEKRGGKKGKRRLDPGRIFVYLARLVDRCLYPAVKHLAENMASKLHRDSASSSAFPYFYIFSFTFVLKTPPLHSFGSREPPNWGLGSAGKRGEPLKGDYPPPTPPPTPMTFPKRSFATCPDLGSQGGSPLLREQAASGGHSISSERGCGGLKARWTQKSPDPHEDDFVGGRDRINNK